MLNSVLGASYPMGSGTVESAGKQVIAARLKQAGMRWTKAGAQAALNLRTHLLSGRGDAIWPLPSSPTQSCLNLGAHPGED